jgi:N-acetyl-alpha-D-muramate 1-phosphate uridylyltransferase
MKAMIFSAGLGTRFKPWTDRHPKPLAPVNGKSLLQRNVEYLQQYGITDIIVNVHHFAGQVVDAIKENNGWGSKITLSDETDELLDTGGGLLKAKEFFTPGETFITCNADILTDLNIHRILEFHEKNKPFISLGVTTRKTSRYLLFDKSDRLCGWRNHANGAEKIPLTHPDLVEKAYSSVAVFEYEILNTMPFTGKFSLIDVYLHFAPTHSILGFDHTGDRWVDVGKPETVATAELLFP